MSEEDLNGVVAGITPPLEALGYSVAVQKNKEEEAPSAVDETPGSTATESERKTEPGMINRYGRTNARVYFRTKPSTYSKSQGELKKNTIVYIIYTEKDEFDEQWTCVDINGKIGFIISVFVDEFSEEESSEWASKQATPATVYHTKDEVEQIRDTK